MTSVKNFLYRSLVPDEVKTFFGDVNEVSRRISKYDNKLEEVQQRLLDFTEENTTSLLLILIDIVPSLYNEEHIHAGRYARLLLDLCRIFKVDKLIIKKLLDKIIEQHQNITTIEAQGKTINPESTYNSMMNWVSLVGTLLVGTVPSVMVMRRVSDSLRLMDIAFKVTSSHQLKTVMQELLPKFMLTWMELSNPIDDKPYGNMLTEIRKFIAVHQSKRKMHYNTQETRDFKRYAAWLDEEIIALSVDMSTPYSLLSILKDCRTELDKLKGDFLNEDFDPHPTEPFCIYLYGQPGSGKSTISKYLAKEINNNNFKVPISDLFYVKNPGDAYATGYKGQFAWIYDDFAQNLSGDDGLELIKYITPQKAPLNMPSLNDPSIGIKGTLNTSLLFVCCSNTGYPIFPNLLSTEALWRRRHIVAEVIKGRTPLEASILLTDPLRENCVIAPRMSVKDFFVLCNNKFKNHMELQADLRDQYMNYMVPNLESEGDEFVDAPSPITAERVELVEQDVQSVFSKASNAVLKFLGAYKNTIMTMLSVGAIAGSAYFVGKKIYGSKPADQSFDNKIKDIQCEGSSDYFSNKRKRRNFKVYDDVDEDNWRRPQTAADVIASLRALDKRMGDVGPEGVENIVNIKVGQKLTQEQEKILCDANEQIQMSENVPPEMKIKVKKHIALLLKKQKIQSEGCEDKIADDICTNLSKQLIEIRTSLINNDSKRIITMHALPIIDTVVLAPRHLFMYEGKYIEGAEITVVSNFSYPTILFSSKNIYEFKHNGEVLDVVLYRLGERVRPFKKITQLFVDDKDLSKLYFTAGALLTRKDSAVRHTYTPDARLIVSDVKYNASGIMQELGSVICYEIPTKKGDCGSPFVAYNTNLRGKILGIHIAGDVNKSLGFCKVVTREMIEKGLSKFNSLVDGCGLENIKPKIVEAEGLEWEIDLPLIGKLDYTNYIPDKTKYVPSLAFEIAGKHVSEPAVLHPDDPRGNGTSPLLNGVAKYANKVEPIQLDLLNKIDEALHVIFEPVLSSPNFVLTEDQALNGVDGFEYCDALNFQSSAGWPYKADTSIAKLKGKDALFATLNNRRIVDHQLLRTRLDKRESLAKQGQRIDSIWLDMVKDETRPIKKITTNNTRVFAIAPVDFTILLRKMTLTFCANMMKHRINVPVAVGINPYSLEWTKLAYKMQEVGSKGFACDYTRYDGSMHPEFIHLTFKLIASAYNYTQEQENTLSVLESEIIHTIQCARNTVYMTYGGNPSGNPITSILNSIVNVCYILYGYFTSVEIQHQNTYSFINNVRTIVYGDDNVIFVRPNLHNQFNFIKFRDALSNLGVTVTCETKDGKDELWRPIEEISFLSNGFRRDGSIFKATLKKEAILEMVNWVSNSIDRKIATQDNINTALRFLYFYGREEFEKYKNIWRKWATQTYSDLDSYYNTCGELSTNISDVLQQIEAQGNTITTITNQNGWSKVGSNTLPIDVTGDRLDMKFKASTMDKPSCTLAMAPTVLKDFQGMANATNVDYNNSLAINSNSVALINKLNTPEDEDEMSVAWLSRRWGAIFNYLETTAIANNAILIDGIHLDPCCQFNDYVKPDSKYFITPLAMITSQANFWRGSMEYRFIFFCDGFTSLKICADFRYNIFLKGEVAPNNDAKRGSMYCAIMDVSPNKFMFDVRVPYMTNKAWCSVRNFNSAYSAQGNTGILACALGKFHVSVLNAPTGQTTRAKIQFLVLQRGGTDYQLAGSYNNNMSIAIEGYEEIIGNVGPTKATLGLTAPAGGSIVNTIGNNAPESEVAQQTETITSMSSTKEGFEAYFNRWQILQQAVAISATDKNITLQIWPLVRSLPMFKSFFDQYMYFKCKHIEVRIEVNGNPYCGGGMICAFIPVLPSPNDETYALNNIFALQHGILNYNTTSAVTLRAPMLIDADYVDLWHTDTNIIPFGSIALNREIVLQKETTTQAPNYTIYVRIVDPILKIPTFVSAYAQGNEIREYLDQSASLTEMITIGEDFPLPEDYTVYDPYTSLRMSIKRFVPFKPFNDVVVTIKPGETTTAAINVRGLLAKQGTTRLCDRIYGFHRGGVRLKMRFVAQYSNQEANATAPQPVPPTIIVSMGSSAIDASVNPYTYVNMESYFKGETNFVTKTMPIDATLQSGFIEFELPFANNNNWRMTLLDTQNSSAVKAYVFMKNNHKYASVDITSLCFCAAADDMRYKTFLGLEKAQVKTNQRPDLYTAVA